MPTKRDIEKWVEQREPQEPDGSTDIHITDEVVETGWTPPEGEDKPEAGVSSETVRFGPNGNRLGDSEHETDD